MSRYDFGLLDERLAEYGINKRERERIIRNEKKKWEKFIDTLYESCETIRRDIEIMYDSFIDQFYQYITTSYIRHGATRPGTGYGENLYRANDVFIDMTNGSFSMGYDFNAKDMEGGYKYKSKSKEEILDQVMSGYRYQYNDDYSISWVGSYESKLTTFKIYGATINEALNEYEKQFNDLLRGVFRKKL